MKGGGGGGQIDFPPQEKTTLKKPSLIRFKQPAVYSQNVFELLKKETKTKDNLSLHSAAPSSHSQ